MLTGGSAAAKEIMVKLLPLLKSASPLSCFHYTDTLRPLVAAQEETDSCNNMEPKVTFQREV